jgi:hypothetical protein
VKKKRNENEEEKDIKRVRKKIERYDTNRQKAIGERKESEKE